MILIVIYMIIMTCEAVHGHTGQFYGFDGHISGDDRHQNTRPRTCPVGTIESCLYCDCYSDRCDIDRQERLLNRNYKGLFSNTMEHNMECDTSNEQVIGTTGFDDFGVDTNESSKGRPNSRCCETNIKIVADNEPFEHDGITRTPVTSSMFGGVSLINEQFRVEGECMNLSPCGKNGHGKCKQEFGFTEILVHSLQNRREYEFVSVPYKSYCRCSFLGVG
ncbi:unnamed protein product [Mytilus coruscus]|uniref:Spaetzle domain-containing protein n=1 Tax=Mytilus coruscus TaxID=42192 RepID=A0A6J8CU12_MYTCO|nr:unnamed protein product [Mytilus coruscus]